MHRCARTRPPPFQCETFGEDILYQSQTQQTHVRHGARGVRALVGFDRPVSESCQPAVIAAAATMEREIKSVRYLGSVNINPSNLQNRSSRLRLSRQSFCSAPSGVKLPDVPSRPEPDTTENRRLYRRHGELSGSPHGHCIALSLAFSTRTSGICSASCLCRKVPFFFGQPN